MNITCPQCGFGRTVNEEKLPPKAVMATCPKCQHRFKFREIAPLEPSTPEAAPENTRTEPVGQDAPSHAPKQPLPEPQSQEKNTPPAAPHDEDLWNGLAALNEDDEDESFAHSSPEPSLPLWERVDSGYPRAFFQTFLEVLARPKAFFSAMPVGHGMVKPLFFFLVITQTVALFLAFWHFLGIGLPTPLTENFGQTTQAILALVLHPLEMTVSLFVLTAIHHFFLHLFNADTKGFEGTFRAEAYSIAPWLLMIVPYIGLPLAMIGCLVYLFLALRHVHGASNTQVLATIILPMLLVTTMVIVLTLLTGGP